MYMARDRTAFYEWCRTNEARILFMAKVEKTGKCWIWTGRFHDGYGYFIHSVGEVRGASAHRSAYEMFKGPIPKDLVIDHLCGNKVCVNPRHLEAVTDAENKRRGNGPAAINHRKTHCKRGHEFNEQNTYINPRYPRGRCCKVCRRSQSRIRMNRYYAKRRKIRALLER